MSTSKFILELDGEGSTQVMDAIVEMIVDTLPELIERGAVPKFIVGFTGDSEEFDTLKIAITEDAARNGVAVSGEAYDAKRMLKESKANARKAKARKAKSDDPFLKKLREQMLDD